jgi:hypothetical protein
MPTLLKLIILLLVGAIAAMPLADTDAATPNDDSHTTAAAAIQRRNRNWYIGCVNFEWKHQCINYCEAECDTSGNLVWDTRSRECSACYNNCWCDYTSAMPIIGASSGLKEVEDAREEGEEGQGDGKTR